jgi:hypothetical protein
MIGARTEALATDIAKPATRPRRCGRATVSDRAFGRIVALTTDTMHLALPAIRKVLDSGTAYEDVDR